MQDHVANWGRQQNATRAPLTHQELAIHVNTGGCSKLLAGSGVRAKRSNASARRRQRVLGLRRSSSMDPGVSQPLWGPVYVCSTLGRQSFDRGERNACVVQHAISDAERNRSLRLLGGIIRRHGCQSDLLPSSRTNLKQQESNHQENGGHARPDFMALVANLVSQVLRCWTAASGRWSGECLRARSCDAADGGRRSSLAASPGRHARPCRKLGEATERNKSPRSLARNLRFTSTREAAANSWPALA